MVAHHEPPFPGRLSCIPDYLKATGHRWWVDTGVMLVAPTLPDVDCVIAQQSDRELDGVVM
jgi:hypothetical protein